MEGKIYPQKLNSDDPNFFLKKSLIDSINYLHDKWRDDKDRMYSKIYFALSLFLTIVSSLLIKYLGLISILILANSLALLLIIYAKRFDKQRKRFEENRKVMKKSSDEWGLEWRD